MFRVCHAFLSVHCSLVVTWSERANLSSFVSDVYCVFVTLLCGVLVFVWYLIVLISDLCLLTYFYEPACMTDLCLCCSHATKSGFHTTRFASAFVGCVQHTSGIWLGPLWLNLSFTSAA